MEHPGAITYADRLLLQDPERTSLSRRRRMANTIAHELAHQWFGDWVTMEWWNDLWLNESFADWLADKVTDQVYPEFEVGVQSEIDAQEVFRTDARATTKAIRKPVTSTGNLLQGLGIAYNKGKGVLRTFEGWMGEENFRKGVVEYLEANAWGNATADDLWAALAAQSHSPAAEALALYVEQPGFPLVTVELLEGNVIQLTQERFRNRGAESQDQLWKIPVSLMYPEGDRVVKHTVLFTEKTQTIQLETTPDWILPKSGGASYYRWNLSSKLMSRLDQVNSNVFDVRERIDFIANAAALFDAGHLTGGEYLDVLSRAAEDPGPRVVDYLIGRLGVVKGQFVVPEIEDSFAAYVRHLLRPSWERIGPTPKTDEPVVEALLRPRLLTWLGTDGKDKEVADLAKNWMSGYFADPSSIPAALFRPTVQVAASSGSEELFNQYLATFEKAEDPGERSTFLRGLAHFDDPALFRRALDICLQHPEVRSNEILTAQRSGRSTAQKREVAYRWFEENYEEIVERIPGIYVAMLPRVARGCDVEIAARATAFFSLESHQVPGTQLEMDRVQEGVRVCQNLREAEGVAIANYLERAAKER